MHIFVKTLMLIFNLSQNKILYSHTNNVLHEPVIYPSYKYFYVCAKLLLIGDIINTGGSRSLVGHRLSFSSRQGHLRL